MDSKRRAALRAEAHHLSATVHVGHAGVTESLRSSLEDALRNHELVKIQFVRNADVNVKDSANALAGSVGAEVIQVIGRTASIFRAKPDETR